MASTRRITFAVTAALAAGAAIAVPAVSYAATSDHRTTPVVASAPVTKSVPSGQKPTVVLVHGAWADSGSWSSVIQRLRKDGYPVRAAGNPLRGIAEDAASVRSLVDSIDGPVVLVGHSYGGAVISAAAAGDDKVKSLVYLTAFAPEKGESVGDLAGRKVANPIPVAPTVPVPTSDGGTDLYLDPAGFRSVFAADVPKRAAAVLAATQRPIAAAAFGEKATAAAWSTIPSWYLVATKDQAIAPETQRFMARRAGSTISQVSSSHAVMVSHPAKVTQVIEAAAR
ncbi:alpha/beta hydrolase [Kineosporia mesophila]|uniref:Alpha/beta hydrolase n=1 Tax=Kineosporia mesophila TaxID=566012 RepID=A0ABP6Z7L5_9ACTN|nr:alpha/beta hydrolase [Kineosporia mesophila]MCD5353048.1 alpha/beta hydrolase [Kineosporia mesophila]